MLIFKFIERTVPVIQRIIGIKDPSNFIVDLKNVGKVGTFQVGAL